MPSPAPLDWSAIDTVLLDMDGTLLDLRFDTWFWEEHIPHVYGAPRGLCAAQARELLRPRFRAVMGTIDWYCVDYWTRELELDVIAIKRAAARERVGYLPGAEGFLRRLRASGKRRVLVTNAHPRTLAVKDEQVGLMAHFDACYSTRTFDVPKEAAAFWPRLRDAEPFTPARTLFVDDSLPVLDAARAFGIGCLRAIRRPDSGRPAQQTGAHAGIDGVADLL